MPVADDIAAAIDTGEDLAAALQALVDGSELTEHELRQVHDLRERLADRLERLAWGLRARQG